MRAMLSALVVLAVTGCSLNPQPLPPDAPDAADAEDADDAAGAAFPVDLGVARLVSRPAATTAAPAKNATISSSACR